jgi:hypothetical protein
MGIAIDRVSAWRIRGAALVLVALAGPALFNGPARSEPEPPVAVEIDGQWFVLPVPPGYCTVERDVHVDGFQYDRFAAALGSGKRLLLWFAECMTLRHTSTTPGTPFVRYGLYLTPDNRNGSIGNFVDLTRAEFARSMARTVPNLDLDTLSDEIRGRWQATIGTTAGAASGERFGIIAHDRQAYYLAIVNAAAARDRGGLQAGVVAGTLLHGRSISVALYRSVAAVETLHRLRWDAEALVTALIEANPDSDTGVAGWRIDGNRLALWGIKIAMIFLAIGVVNFFWKRWYRRRGVAP